MEHEITISSLKSSGGHARHCIASCPIRNGFHSVRHTRNIGQYRSGRERDRAFEQNHCTPALCSSETGLTLQAPRSHNDDETRILSHMVRATVAARKFSQRSLVREDFACLIPF